MARTQRDALINDTCLLLTILLRTDIFYTNNKRKGAFIFYFMLLSAQVNIVVYKHV